MQVQPLLQHLDYVQPMMCILCRGKMENLQKTKDYSKPSQKVMPSLMILSRQRAAEILAKDADLHGNPASTKRNNYGARSIAKTKTPNSSLRSEITSDFVLRHFL
jgi:hypothetical protein